MDPEFQRALILVLGVGGIVIGTGTVVLALAFRSFGTKPRLGLIVGLVAWLALGERPSRPTVAMVPVMLAGVRTAAVEVIASATLAAFIGVGAMEYPAEFQGASEERLAEIGVSRIITLTSTYDHRIIQGAESGEFLRRLPQLLPGDDNFYADIFTPLRIPDEPVRWVKDIPEGEVDKTARVLELIDAYRTRGHLMADTDPLEYRARRHPDLDVREHDLTLWDLDRSFPVGGFAGQQRMRLRDILGVLRDSYCRRVGVEYMHIYHPEQKLWIQERMEGRDKEVSFTPEGKIAILRKLVQAEDFEHFCQVKYTATKRFGLEGGEALIPAMEQIIKRGGQLGWQRNIVDRAAATHV